MNFIVTYSAEKCDPINLDLIVSITTLDKTETNLYTIRFYTTTPGVYFDWEYINEHTGEQEYNRVMSTINPPEPGWGDGDYRYTPY